MKNPGIKVIPQSLMMAKIPIKAGRKLQENVLCQILPIHHPVVLLMKKIRFKLYDEKEKVRD
jgi:hypothetical protein